MVIVNHRLRSIETYTFIHGSAKLVSANDASSNSGQIEKKNSEMFSSMSSSTASQSVKLKNCVHILEVLFDYLLVKAIAPVLPPRHLPQKQLKMIK